jgi:hypothetical protein
MYLIHAEILPPECELPCRVADLISDQAEPSDGLQHVEPHPDALGGPVLGLFVLAESLEAAEAAAGRICLRAVRHLPEFAGLSLGRCEAVLVPGHHDRLMGVGETGMTGGVHNGSGTD